MNVKQRLAQATIDERLSFKNKYHAISFLSFFGYSHKHRTEDTVYYHGLDFDKSSYCWMEVRQDPETEYWTIIRHEVGDLLP